MISVVAVLWPRIAFHLIQEQILSYPWILLWLQEGSWGKHSFPLVGRHVCQMSVCFTYRFLFPAMCCAFSLSCRNDFPDEKIPTLREAVAECLRHNLTVFFDVKGHANMATDALKKIYMEFPQLYNNSIVCSFLPEVIYKMRQADQNVLTALIHRPWSLSHTGDGKPRFDTFWKQSTFVALDILLDWSMHNILWYLCGISAFLIQKDFVSPAYLKKWSAKGIQVVAWTVNTFDEKSYYESHLGSSYITDSMLEDCSPQF